MTKPLRKVAVLLAGGASQRMRRDKASLEFDGKTLLTRGADLLQSLVIENLIDEYVVSGPYPQAIEDDSPHLGPVGGIFSIIGALQLNIGDLLLAVPIDMPLLQKSHLETLIDFTLQNGRTCCYLKAWLPICLVISPQLLEAMEKQKATKKGLSVRALLELSKGDALPPDESHDLVNTNTPEQWQKLIKEHNR